MGNENKINNKVMFNLGYGLYLATCFDGNKHNGTICNSVMQATSDPQQLVVILNKNGYGCQTILKTKKLNICPLTEKTPFSVFQQFGFKSGKDTNKFENITFDGKNASISENGLAVLNSYANSYISLEVTETNDLGTHILFVCKVTEAVSLNTETTISYNYYQQNVKPKAVPAAKKKFVCTICGYVYEGENLPADFVCPWCGHDATFFEQVG